MFCKLTLLCVIFRDFFHIQIERGKYSGLFCGILLVPHNVVMDMDDVMCE